MDENVNEVYSICEDDEKRWGFRFVWRMKRWSMRSDREGAGDGTGFDIVVQ